MITLIAFIVAIVILVTVHEGGHFFVARFFGVKVLCFSIGFGPALKIWTAKKTGTQYKLSAIPLGGYVKMADERESAVAAADLAHTFNRQALYKRTLIVLAGPVFNLLLAVILYACINWMGVLQFAPILSTPDAHSALDKAGLQAGDQVQAAGFKTDDLTPTPSFASVQEWLVQASLAHKNLYLEVLSPTHTQARLVEVNLRQINLTKSTQNWLSQIGLVRPFTPPIIEAVMPNSPAQKAGLQAGDWVRSVDSTPIVDTQGLQYVIGEKVTASSVKAAKTDGTQSWVIIRDQIAHEIKVTPAFTMTQGKLSAQVGIYLGGEPQTVMVRYGPVEGIIKGAEKVKSITVLTLRSISNMLVGKISIKNISGPITIAQYAGKSVEISWQVYLEFLAFVSVSLGILNLLPLPVLDGGHLLYYVWEAVTRKEVSVVLMERLQKMGFCLILLLMMLALFNDFSRILTG